MISTVKAGEISKIRELTEQPEQPEDIELPPSINTIREMTASVEALIDRYPKSSYLLSFFLPNSIYRRYRFIL
ncbi:MAG: hypothetical protein K8S15_02430 [Candidatus Aegiribacteria sp.]|nr:hypothetical protein [Candidatus Aegiribacteria sp.]